MKNNRMTQFIIGFVSGMIVLSAVLAVYYDVALSKSSNIRKLWTAMSSDNQTSEFASDESGDYESDYGDSEESDYVRDDESEYEEGYDEGEYEEGYSPSVPAYPPDLDCEDIGEQVEVTGDDPHGLDRDGDGIGCESY